ncbi:ATP-grasp domain-containing protein [Alkalispirillum mobile]|uniref:ATP-grasp domain-containing protein n=1 Tax=Alkalispirillum mobile TaxID=85925 RepID=A0A498C930_9GAMM|nr:ATP-grasp domain-containing protein [Alkalispirillum mobile]RLK51649.1 ATP-grasp domain-containing protein [Alkalispirillum mobile]
MTDDNCPKRVALLSCGPPIALKVLYCLHRLGARTDLVDLRRPSMARYSRYRSGHRGLHLDDTSPDGLARFGEALQAYCQQRGIEAVVGGDILAAGIIHAVSGQLTNTLAFPASPLSTLGMLDDKWRFQTFMVKHDIPCPRAICLESTEDVDNIETQGLRFPLVIKPLYGESSHGIVRVAEPGAIHHHLASGGRHARFPLLAQEYAPGFDADLSVLAKDGEVLCHVLQSRRSDCSLAFFEDESVLEIGRQIVRAANYTGVANIDVRIDEHTGEVRVLECNPRFWYTLQASLWAGLNFVEAGFAVARGEPVNHPAPTTGAYHLHSCLLKRLLWRPGQWRHIAPYNLRGLLQAATDPLPFIMQRFG